MQIFRVAETIQLDKSLHHSDVSRAFVCLCVCVNVLRDGNTELETENIKQDKWWKKEKKALLLNETKEKIISIYPINCNTKYVKQDAYTLLERFEQTHGWSNTQWEDKEDEKKNKNICVGFIYEYYTLLYSLQQSIIEQNVFHIQIDKQLIRWYIYCVISSAPPQTNKRIKIVKKYSSSEHKFHYSK